MRGGWRTLATITIVGTIVGAIVGQLVGCGGDRGEPAAEGAATTAASAGEVVTPPFAVRGDAEGLLLTWFDESGAHTATSRHEIPEARRGEVRVDSLEIAPDERDAEHVYVADLRTPGEDGRYAVRRLPREAFDQRVSSFGETMEGGGPASSGAVAAGEIVIFGASWCGACRQAEAFFRARGIPFVERDIETDPGAQAEMQRRAAAAGIRPTGIPVIDVRGRVMQGFDPEAIERALRETGAAGAAGGGGISI